MFYKIGNKYYILIGSIYTEVTFDIHGDNVRAIPTSKTLEKTSNIKAREMSFDMVKEELLKPRKHFNNDFEEDKGVKRDRRSRFDR